MQDAGVAEGIAITNFCAFFHSLKYNTYQKNVIIIYKIMLRWAERVFPSERSPSRARADRARM